MMGPCSFESHADLTSSEPFLKREASGEAEPIARLHGSHGLIRAVALLVDCSHVEDLLAESESTELSETDVLDELAERYYAGLVDAWEMMLARASE